jgi:predicted RNA-binding Zn-ribbon protein involved in translation (DUF1610 family)
MSSIKNPFYHQLKAFQHQLKAIDIAVENILEGIEAAESAPKSGEKSPGIYCPNCDEPITIPSVMLMGSAAPQYSCGHCGFFGPSVTVRN